MKNLKKVEISENIEISENSLDEIFERLFSVTGES